MITRLIALRMNLVQLTQVRKLAAYRCDAHMNELPIPCGPWEPWYKDKQSYYTKTLVFGTLWHLFSLIMAIWTNSLYFNWGPPAQPGPPSDMVEECDDADT